MKIPIEKEEWQLMGQMILDIINGNYPAGLLLEAHVLMDWYCRDVEKFQFPRKRKQQFKTPVHISLLRMLLHKKEQWEADPYWQVTTNGFVDKIYRASFNTTAI